MEGLQHHGVPTEVLIPREKIIADILAHAIFEHDEKNPRLFRAHFVYGSKFLDCYAQKDKKIVGGIIENFLRGEKKQEETTLLYEAFYRCLCGIANRLGKELTYTFLTGNEKLMAWAKIHGDKIFHWIESQEDKEEHLMSFTCKVRPTISKRKAEIRRSSQVAQILRWETRRYFAEY